MASDGRIFPAVVKVAPGSLVLISRTRWPAEASMATSDYLASALMRGLTSEFEPSTRAALCSLDDLYWELPVGDIDRLYQHEYAQTLCQVLRKSYAYTLGHELYLNHASGPADFLALATTERILDDAFRQEFNLEDMAPGSVDIQPPPPDRGERSADVEAWLRAQDPGDESALIRDVTIASARLVAEAWIATVTTFCASEEDQMAYVHRRIQNAWLLQSWSEIDELWQDRDDPDRTALYLALGFSQSTTTWQWPATECWVDLFQAEPPEHWLPRSLWHLCWLLHDPEDDGHRQAFDAALDEGAGDAERPGVAEALRRLFKSTT